MTTAWLIAAVILLAMLFAFSLAFGAYQVIVNAHLKGRIQSIGVQLRHVPKRESDRK